MLALTRRPGERVNLYAKTAGHPMLIGSVTLVDCNTQKAKLGFEFPESVIIAREEVDEHAKVEAQG